MRQRVKRDHRSRCQIYQREQAKWPSLRLDGTEVGSSGNPEKDPTRSKVAAGNCLACEVALKSRKPKAPSLGLRDKAQGPIIRHRLFSVDITYKFTDTSRLGPLLL